MSTRTIEELEAEIDRLQTDLRFVRENASQMAMKAKGLEESLLDTVAQAIFTELVSQGGGNVSDSFAKKAFAAAQVYLQVRANFVK